MAPTRHWWNYQVTTMAGIATISTGALVLTGYLLRIDPAMIVALLGLVLAVHLPAYERAAQRDYKIDEERKMAVLVGWRIYTEMLLLRDRIDEALINFGQRDDRGARDFIVRIPSEINEAWLEFRHFPPPIAHAINQGVGLVKLHNKLMKEDDRSLVDEPFKAVYFRQVLTAGELIHQGCLGLATMLGETAPKTRHYQPNA